MAYKDSPVCLRNWNYAGFAVAVFLGDPGMAAEAGMEPLHSAHSSDFVQCGPDKRNSRQIEAFGCDLTDRMVSTPLGVRYAPLTIVRSVAGGAKIELQCVPPASGSKNWRRAGAVVTLDRPFLPLRQREVTNSLLRDAMRVLLRRCPQETLWGSAKFDFVTIAAPTVAGRAPHIVMEVRNFGLGIWNHTSYGPEGAIGRLTAIRSAAPRRSETVSAPAAARGFLISPLTCGDPACRTRYADPYAPALINSVLDHSMMRNRNGFWQYGTTRNGGGDGMIIAFNGETAREPAQSSDPTCISGAIRLRADRGGAMTNGRGCGAGYASYDEHPGYDYRAAAGTPVRAAGAGRVLNLDGQRCYRSNIAQSCDDWGYIGIDHGNGYITQYGHLSRIDVAPGKMVMEGQRIGLSGDRGTPGSPHLHFEVLVRVSREYLVVDPYGWVGHGDDPLL